MEFWEYLKEYLTPQTIVTITAVISFLVALLKLVSVVKTLNKQKAMTMSNLLTALTQLNTDLYEKEKQELIRVINTLIQPLIMYSQTFAKVMALSQENTPESRVAILNLIQDMGSLNPEIIEQAKAVVEEQETAKEEKKVAMIEELSKIENKPIE